MRWTGRIGLRPLPTAPALAMPERAVHRGNCAGLSPYNVLAPASPPLFNPLPLPPTHPHPHASPAQVYPAGLRHIRPDRRINDWRAPGRKTIVKAATNERQVAIALSGGEIIYFELNPQVGLGGGRQWGTILSTCLCLRRSFQTNSGSTGKWFLLPLFSVSMRPAWWGLWHPSSCQRAWVP